MVAEPDALRDRLRQRLLADTGRAGWGYYSTKAGRIEPTCWALLALSSAWDSSAGAWQDVARPHLAWLAGLQGPDGLLVETEPAYANLTANGLAAIVFARLADAAHSKTTSSLYRGLVAVKGVRLEAAEGGQDNTLQGWPWVRDTFSWVEPTAWCLLALKLAPAAERTAEVSARVAEAERLMTNRVCSGGGWNYGNATTLGQDLRPYVPTTAAGLLAMQDQRDSSPVMQSAQRLSELRLTERSAVALSLTSLALRVCGMPADDVDAEVASIISRSEESGHLQALALALLALTAGSQGAEVLRVGA